MKKKLTRQFLSSLLLLMSLSVFANVFLVDQLRIKHKEQEKAIIHKRIKGEADSILSHFYQVSNFAQMINVLDSYKHTTVSCLKLIDMDGDVLYQFGEENCGQYTSLAKNHLDQNILKISYGFQPFNMKDTISANLDLFIPGLFFQFILISLVMYYLANKENSLLELQKKTERIKAQESFEKQLTKLSRQVAHDVKSPIAALRVILGSKDFKNEEEKLIVRSSIQRINDILNNLVLTNNNLDKSFETNISNHHVYGLIDSLVSEKRSEFLDIANLRIEFQVTEDSYSAFAQLDASGLKRSLSNIINNAVEATESRMMRSVVLRLKQDDHHVKIYIEDNGNGIAPESMTKIFDDGFTHGKKFGQGLGLLFAKKFVDRFEGEVFVDSSENQGTVICLQFPKQEAPAWFCEKIDIKNFEDIVLVDDEASVHHAWDQILNQSKRTFHFQQLYNAEDFIDEHKTKPYFAFIDYNFEFQEENGLDFIVRKQLQKNSLLVTSKYDDKNLQEACEEAGVKMVPKAMLDSLQMNL